MLAQRLQFLNVKKLNEKISATFSNFPEVSDVYG
jgi:hypothetical protein